MRLMPEGVSEMPAETYVKYKNNIQLWYDEMTRYKLTADEQELLKKELGHLCGVADSQESIMLLTMNPQFTGFDVIEANVLRKSIAKKDAKVLEKAKALFYEKGKTRNISSNMLDYVWKVVIGRQVGYSFSVLHTIGYSTIALQEMNLAYKYPIIYWNTACLTVNAGALNEDDMEFSNSEEEFELDKPSYNVIETTDDEEDEEVEDSEEDTDTIAVAATKKKTKTTDYGKIAAAIGKIQSLGITVQLPDINSAKFSFTPNEENNTIIFGMKGINRIGDELVYKIIQNRPYCDLFDFLSKVKLNKTQMIMLIKGGSFDNLYPDQSREDIIRLYINHIYEPKKRLTLQNMAMLINHNLLPEELCFQKRIYSFNKYLKKELPVVQNCYILDDRSLEFFTTYYEDNVLQVIDNKCSLPVKIWTKTYEKEMDKVRNWIKSTPDLLNQLNQCLFDEQWNKYCKTTNISSWEMESICFYYHPHELEDVRRDEYDIANFFLLSENPPVSKVVSFNGKNYPRFELVRIIGTVLDRNKTRHTVSLLTPEGVVIVKLYRSQFAKYDKQISEKLPTGKKRIVEKGWFTRGNQLMITGFRRGDQFIPKTYKDHPYQCPIYKIVGIKDDNTLQLISDRIEI